MKRLVLFASAICLFAACSQKGSIAVDSPSSSKVFEATTASTRTYVDGLNVAWDTDDAISIFDKTIDNQEYVYAGEAGATKGNFVAAPDNDEASGEAVDKVYAAYPYASYNECLGDAMYLYFSPKQTFTPLSFAPGANIMVAQSDNNSLAFKNACGYLKLMLYGDSSSPVEEVDLYGKNGELISGDANVYFSETGEPVVELDEESKYTVDYAYVPFEEPVTLPGKSMMALSVWFAIPPIVFEDGIIIEVYSSDGRSFTYESSNPLEIKRGVCTATAPLEVTFPDPAGADEIEEDLAGYYIVSSTSAYASEGYGPYTDDIIYISAAPEGSAGNVLIEGSLIGGLPVSFYANYVDGVINIPAGTVVYHGVVWSGDSTEYDVSMYIVVGTSIYAADIPLQLTGDHQLEYVYNGEANIAFLDDDYYALDILDSITFTYYNPSGSAKRFGLPAFKARQKALKGSLSGDLKIRGSHVGLSSRCPLK